MPWEETARAFLARTIAESGYQLPSDPTNLTLAAVADVNDVPGGGSTPASPTASGATCSATTR